MTDGVLPDDPIEAVWAMTAGLAATLSRRFGDFADTDDIRQVMLEWALRHTEKVAEYLTSDREAALAITLRREGERFCRKEKARISGYETRDEFNYSLDTIVAVLPCVISGDYDPPAQVMDDMPTGRTVASEGNNWLCMCIDVSIAWETLDEAQREVLTWLYRDRLNQKESAEKLGVATSTMSRYVNKALRAMQLTLRGERSTGGPGTRKVMSNSQSQAMGRRYE